MDHCDSCGRSLREDVRYCPGCGTPTGSSGMSPPRTRVAPPYEMPSHDERYASDDRGWATPSYDEWPATSPAGSRRGVVPALAAAMVALALGVGVAVFLLVRQPAEAETTVTPPVVAQSVPSYPPPTDAGGASTYSTPPGTTPSVSAEQALYDQVSSDSATTESLNGYWVPQVSSKKVGKDGFTEELILQDYRTSVSSRPGTGFVLVRSDSFTSFDGQDYWVTLAATRFSSATGANGWCDAEGYGRQDCYAKRLSHTEGPKGNSVPRD